MRIRSGSLSILDAMLGTRALGLVAIAAFLAAALLPCPPDATEVAAPAPGVAGHSHGPGGGHDPAPASDPGPLATELTAPCFCGCGDGPGASSAGTRLSPMLPSDPGRGLAHALPARYAPLEARPRPEPFRARDPAPV